MKSLIDFIKLIEENIKVDEKDKREPFVNAYYIEENLKLILANLIIENDRIKKISNK